LFPLRPPLGFAIFFYIFLFFFLLFCRKADEVVISIEIDSVNVMCVYLLSRTLEQRKVR
jgi:hypothetical protein